jgi:hypothetical protein
MLPELIRYLIEQGIFDLGFEEEWTASHNVLAHE